MYDKCSDCEYLDAENLRIENRFLREENQELKADYGTKAQVERDLLMEENQKYKEVIDKAIKELNDYLNINTVIRDELLDILKEVE